MLSIGWTEMMLVAAVALIVVGPKDLPGMLRQIGKAVGSVRRMGNDFKAELNKVTAVDELKDIKNSIAAPLTDVRRSVEKEFNSIAPSGQVIPSGKIAPASPDAQSVADEIKNAAGIEGKQVDPDAAKASIAEAVTKARDNTFSVADEAKAMVIKKPTKPPVRKPKTPSAAKSTKPATPKASTSKPATTSKPAAKRPTGKKPVVKKPSAKKSPAKKPVAKKPAKSEAK